MKRLLIMQSAAVKFLSFLFNNSKKVTSIFVIKIKTHKKVIFHMRAKLGKLKLKTLAQNDLNLRNKPTRIIIFFFTLIFS